MPSSMYFCRNQKGSGWFMREIMVVILEARRLVVLYVERILLKLF